MTATSVRAPAPAHRVTLRTLALVEARRYARHPLFLVGAGMVVVTSVTARRGDWDASNVDGVAIPAFFLGLLGVFVGHRLTRSVDRSADAVEAAPADGVTRTAALCLACLLPGAVALSWLAWMHLAMALWPVPETSGYSSWDRVAMLGVGVVGAVGGPLVGVLVARWTRFPAAGLVAAVLLVGWCLLGTHGLAMPASRAANLVHLNPPFATWLSADGPDLPWWVAGGSPSWYVAYLVALCGLAATAAMLHEAVGRQRRRLLRALAVIGVVAVTCLTLAATADPTRVPL
jgi:hypothetical protein